MQFVNQKIRCKAEEFYVNTCVDGKKGGATEESVNTIMCSWWEGGTQKSLRFFFFFVNLAAIRSALWGVAASANVLCNRQQQDLWYPVKNKQVTEANTLMCCLKKAAQDSNLIDIYDGLRSVEE